MNWAAAEAYCVSAFGGHLASFHSAAEYTAVMDGLEACHGTLPLGWIGLTDIAQEGTFVWSDGSLLVWTNWETQPDNYNFSEHCVENMHSSVIHNRITWNDNSCSKMHISTAFDGNEQVYPFGAICKSPTASPATALPTASPTSAPAGAFFNVA